MFTVFQAVLWIEIAWKNQLAVQASEKLKTLKQEYGEKCRMSGHIECQAILKARDIPKETALISCSLPKRPPIIVGRVKAASPRQIDLFFIQIDYLSRDCWRKGMILCQLWWWISWPCLRLEARWLDCRSGNPFFVPFLCDVGWLPSRWKINYCKGVLTASKSALVKVVYGGVGGGGG